MKWYFVKYRPDETTRDPIVGEFFSTDAIENPAQALVREGTQNTLDAGRGKPVRVRVYCGRLKDLSKIDFWLSGAWEHYSVPKNGLGNLPERSSEMPFLTFEDFGTYGLQGDVEQSFDISEEKNSFYYFFRAEGRSGKGEQDRGRWGVGKHVFPRASRISTFLALTVRADDKKRFLMGRSILKSRWVNGSYYSPDGYLGVHDNKDKPTLPVSDSKVMDQFCEDFQLQRKDEPGLSIVVPYIESDINISNITKAVIEDYFYPILKGDLSVKVETEGIVTEIDALSLPTLVSSMELGNFAQVIAMAEWALKEEKDVFELNPCSETKPTWSNDLIPSDTLHVLRTKFENGEYLAIKAKLNVRQKEGAEIPSYFTIYLKQGNNDDGHPIFIREGIIISDVKPPRSRGVLSLVVVEDKPLATLLGDSENPAHTQWQKDSSNFKNKYVSGESYIRFVRNIVSNIVSALSAKEDELDANLILDIFSLPVEEEQPKREVKQKQDLPGDETTKVVVDVPFHEKKFILEQVAGGFLLKSSKVKLSSSTKIEIRVAYDVRKGNPLQKYDVSDFKLDQSPIKIKKPTKGLNLVKVHENVILADTTKEDFELSLTGFDQNRDLYVKVKINEDSNDKAI